MSRRAPALHRLGSILQAIGTAVLVLLIVFLGTAAYSAAHLRPQVGSNHSGSSVALDPNGTALVTESVNLSNQGYYDIAPLTVSLEIANASTGAILALGGSGSLTIASGANATIPISVWIPLSGGASQLVTQDAALVERAWVNATYASIFVIHLSGGSNYSWGAPFAGFSATPGTPTVQSNGTVAVPVTIAFSNHAGFTDVGTIAYNVRTSAGVSCSTGALPVDAPAKSSFYQTFTFHSSSSCDPSGGTISATYTGGGLTVALPTESIP